LADCSGGDFRARVKTCPKTYPTGKRHFLKDNFEKAQKILRTSGTKMNIRAVNGCCYGKVNMDRGSYWKISGQVFWEFTSGNDLLYLEIIEPLGHKAKERNQEFLEDYGRIINLFTNQFFQEFCVDGKINWSKLVQFNSSKRKKRDASSEFIL